MTHKLEDHEEAPLWEAVKAAGEYLDSLGVHDLRRLTKGQLLMFGSIIISRFAEQRTKDGGSFAEDFGIGELNDEIPF
jgi:hypothetical protein